MTEKRFTIGDRALQEVYAGCIPAILDGGIPCTQSQVLKLLNELNDEKEEIQYTKNKYDSLKEEFFKQNRRIINLNDENNELKFQLEECRYNKLFSRRELEKENKELLSYINTLGLGIQKILYNISDGKDTQAMIMCVELLKKLEEEKLFGGLND